jgi:uncharacterized protein YcsI (UPF0317 family)
MNDDKLRAIQAVIQEDVNRRGLCTDPDSNLVTAHPDDLRKACQSLADTAKPEVIVVTGFYIPHGTPAGAAETDGPLGAVYLARALLPLGVRVAFLTDPFCKAALVAGLKACGLDCKVPVAAVPHSADRWEMAVNGATHLIALERVGPNHTPESLRLQAGTTEGEVELFLRDVPAHQRDCCYTMGGTDITSCTPPLHTLFEPPRKDPRVLTIGIGDGGNEIGMGKIRWDIVRRNIPRGGLVACRVPTDFLIVCGVSNWGAYALAAGVRLLRGAPFDPALFDPDVERRILQAMVDAGPLVDGVIGEPLASVDGLPFERYVEPLVRIGQIVAPPSGGSMGGTLDLRRVAGSVVRQACRNGDQTGPTPGLALGYVQANLVIVPRDLAFDFLLFCQRNPKPCPLLDVTEPGSAEPRFVAPGADLRTDLPRYCVYENGELVAEPTDLSAYWRDDLVAFLLGCSFTFESALLGAGVPVRHVECGCNVSMYRTNLACRPAGVFHGPMVVSMRPLTPAQAVTATRVCSRFPRAHGAPVHFGDPEAIGIRDIARPDFGDPVEIRPGEVPVFWACGVTPQAVAVQAKPPLLITHKPGHMFVTDLRDTDLEGE